MRAGPGEERCVTGCLFQFFVWNKQTERILALADWQASGGLQKLQQIQSEFG